MVKLCSTIGCSGLGEVLILPMKIYKCKKCLKEAKKKYGDEITEVLDVFATVRR